MAEYYAVLSKAVGSLELSSIEARRAVYDKARNALIGQLKAIDPPLSTSEISRQRLELEEAIRRVERESADRAPAAPAVRADTPPPVTPQQEAFRRPIREAESGAAGGSPPPRMRPPAPPPTAQEHEDTEEDDEAARTPERVERVTPPVNPAHLSSRGYSERDMPSPEPRLAPEYGWEEDTAAPTPAARYPEVQYAEARERLSSVSAGRRRAEAEDDNAEMMERGARPSRLPMLLLLLLIIIMAGGLAALGWSQRGVLMDLVASFDSGSTRAPPAATATTATDATNDDASSAGKNPDRLLAPGETPQTGVRVVDMGPSGQAAGDQGAPQAPAVAPSQPATSMAAATTPPAGGDATGAQTAVLFEEPLDSAAAGTGVVAINGSVTWRYVADSPDGPEITGNIAVPERQFNVKLTIRRNNDASLPASHLVEVVVDTPADFPGKGIKTVPRLILKDSETATRGRPLIGATATITEGFFWVALSGVDADEKTNMALLRDNGWIDVPFVYDSGQRAILTIEKGPTGEQVFKQALAAWGEDPGPPSAPAQDVPPPSPATAAPAQ